MTPEQKQQAQQLIADWTSVSATSTPAVWFLNGDCMAGFLRDLIDSPEVEPVASVTGYYAGHLSIATVDGRVLPAGAPLYTAPPAPSVPDVANTFKRRAEEIVAMAVNRENYAKINRTIADLVTDIANAAETTTQAESPADVARDAELLRKLRHSIRQAMIPGNDWRRELALMNGAINAAMSEKGGA